MKRQKRTTRNARDVESLLAEITAGAAGDDEQLRAFVRALRVALALPLDACVIGEPVVVTAFHYDGNPRRGLVARCRREDGSEHVVSAAELVPDASAEYESNVLAAYRQWLDARPGGESRREAGHKAPVEDLNLSKPLELVVLSVKEKSARCRIVGSDVTLNLRARCWNLIPGEIATVRPAKQWTYGSQPYLSGEVSAMRLDVAALGLTPLAFEDRGHWDPKDHDWGDEPLEPWAESILARGPRPAFEMEQIIPGEDPDDFDSDPICESNDLKEMGDSAGARTILMRLCQADLRCLDAHAHLGNLISDRRPEGALRHYAVGVHIGGLSLPAGFDGLLPWGFLDNRPFLRCLHGYGLSLWQLGRFEDAERVFHRMLWLNPWDNQGARFVLDEVRRHVPWEDHEED